MKALSIDPEYAHYIFQLEKTIECRTWKTNYRGKLLICATQTKVPGCICGHAYFTVDLVDVEEFKEEHLEAAMMDEMPPQKCYAWHLDNVDIIYPIKVRGKLGLFDVPDEQIRYLADDFAEDATEEEMTKRGLEFNAKYIEPITYMPNDL